MRGICRPICRPVCRPVCSTVSGAAPNQTSPTTQLRDMIFGQGRQGILFVPQPLVDSEQALFQDAAGTVSVTADGDPIGLARDISGNEFSMQSAVSAQRPVFNAAGGISYATFDGIDDRLTVLGLEGDPDNWVCAFAVSLRQAVESQSNIFSIEFPGMNMRVGYVTGSNRIFAFLNGATSGTDNQVFAINSPVVVNITCIGGTISYDVNGEPVPAVPQTSPSGNAAIRGAAEIGGGGDYGAITLRANADIYGGVFAFDTLTESEKTEMTEFLLNSAGLSS